MMTYMKMGEGVSDSSAQMRSLIGAYGEISGMVALVVAVGWLAVDNDGRVRVGGGVETEAVVESTVETR